MQTHRNNTNVSACYSASYSECMWKWLSNYYTRRAETNRFEICLVTKPICLRHSILIISWSALCVQTIRSQFLQVYPEADVSLW